jgi:phage/plasmid-associated DNA primase
MTNHPPTIRDTRDNAMLRRLVYVNFPNLYVHRERFDSTNSRHRLVDLELKQRMMEKGSLEQLLSYLVRGAVDWYMRGGLDETPTAMKASLNQYLASNDKLQKFIEDHCAIGEELRAPMMNFLKSYRDATSDREMMAEVLTQQMRDMGYRKKKRETEDEYGKRPQVFVGLRCDYVR